MAKTKKKQVLSILADPDINAYYAHGNVKMVVVGDWIKNDEETGFISEESMTHVLKNITTCLVRQKFTDGDMSEQSVFVIGGMIIITQAINSSGARLNQETAERAAKIILQQFFRQAVRDGYFDEVNTEKLAESVKDEEPAEG